MKMEKKDVKISFIGIGGARSATFWISECLREHPEINIPFPNELHFFSHPSEGKSNYDLEGIEGYYKRFKKSNNKSGEFSPDYLTDPSVPEIIKKHFPNVKILVSLRNPIKRYESEKTYRKTYENVIAEKKDLINRSMYYKNLSRYYKIFPKENVKVVLVDEIDEKSLKTMQGIYEFLGVGKNFVPSVINKTVNKTSKPKYQFLATLREKASETAIYMKKNNLLPVLNILRALKLNKVSWYIWEKNRIEVDKIALSKEEKEELMKIFLPDINKLEKLIEKDLSAWKRIN